jgi:hypothetical protein
LETGRTDSEPRKEDSMKTGLDIEFKLRGEVNGQTFDMDGYGLGDASAGTCELHLKAAPNFPDGFDPVSCPFICSHPTSSFFAQTDGDGFAGLTGGNYAVSPARHGLIRNSKGETLLDLTVTGRTYLQNGKLVSENIMHGFSRLPRMEKNVTPSQDYILPAKAGQATALVRFQMLSKAGEEFDGLTVVPYRWTNGRSLNTILVRNVSEVIVEWNGGREVSAYYRLSIAEASGIVVPAKTIERVA